MERLFSSSESDGETAESNQSSSRNQEKDASQKTSSEAASFIIDDQSSATHIKSENYAETIDSEDEVVVKTESSFSEKPIQVVDISDGKINRISLLIH